jgi:glycosyltransferase involved in cell wall biosynthesis
LVIFSDESRRGPGSYSSLADMATHLNMTEHITIKPGFIEDMRLVYQAIDVYVLPSRGSEGSSRAGLEACASGLPLIASSVGVLPDLVQDRVTGRLIPPNNVEALQSALTELFETWPLALQWGAAARSRMEGEFAEEHYVRKLQYALEQALDSVRPVR